MVSGEIGLDGPPAQRVFAASGIDRRVFTPIIVGLLTALSILLLIYQENRAVQYRIDAAEGWSAYQIKIVQSTSEEDPNLKAQYTEEQDVLRQQGQNLREKSSDARRAVMFSSYAALVLLLGAGAAFFALVSNRIHSSYAGLLLAIIGVGLGIRALF